MVLGKFFELVFWFIRTLIKGQIDFMIFESHMSKVKTSSLNLLAKYPYIQPFLEKK
jgi:hypothetical protein